MEAFANVFQPRFFTNIFQSEFFTKLLQPEFFAILLQKEFFIYFGLILFVLLCGAISHLFGIGFVKGIIAGFVIGIAAEHLIGEELICKIFAIIALVFIAAAAVFIVCFIIYCIIPENKFKTAKKKAKHGEMEAMLALARMYSRGEETSVNKKGAKEFLVKYY